MLNQPPDTPEWMQLAPEEVLQAALVGLRLLLRVFVGSAEAQIAADPEMERARRFMDQITGELERRRADAGAEPGQELDKE